MLSGSTATNPFCFHSAILCRQMEEEQIRGRGSIHAVGMLAAAGQWRLLPLMLLCRMTCCVLSVSQVWCDGVTMGLLQAEVGLRVSC